MQRYTVVPATRTHAQQLAPTLRAIDALECLGMSGLSPLESLYESLEASDPDFVFCLQWQRFPVAMFGTNRMDVPGQPEGTVGGAWLLASNGIYNNKRHFLALSRDVIGQMHGRYEYLTNFLLAQNTASRRWLEWLGWRPVQDLPSWGPMGLHFIQYVSHRNDSPCANPPPSRS